MSWKTISYESIDIRDGLLHELYLTDHDMVDTVQKDSKGKMRKAHLFSGLEKGHHNVNPVKFIATDHLAGLIDPDTLPGLFAIQWRGKTEIKGGKTFNVFTVRRWQGALPEWTQGQPLSLMEEEEIEEPAEQTGADEIDENLPF